MLFIGKYPFTLLSFFDEIQSDPLPGKKYPSTQLPKLTKYSRKTEALKIAPTNTLSQYSKKQCW